MIFKIQIRAKGNRRFSHYWTCLNIETMRRMYVNTWLEGKESGFDVRVVDNDGKPLSPVCLGNIRRMYGVEEAKETI